jgi:hypothetical protein
MIGWTPDEDKSVLQAPLDPDPAARRQYESVEGGSVTREIEIELEGSVVTACLLEDTAPKTVAAFLEALPLSSNAIHCICSGECVWFQDDAVPIATKENETVYLSQGDIAIGYDHDFLIAYGRRCATRGFRGWLPYNPIATVRDMDAMDAFAKVAHATEFEGQKSISVRLRQT